MAWPRVPLEETSVKRIMWTGVNSSFVYSSTLDFWILNQFYLLQRFKLEGVTNLDNHHLLRSASVKESNLSGRLEQVFLLEASRK